VRVGLRLGVLLALALWVTALLPGLSVADEAQQRMDQSRSRYMLGRMYEQAGDLTRAEENYQQALDLWPDNTDARIALQSLIDARKPPDQPKSFWSDWFSWLPGGATGAYATSVLEVFGWIVMLVVFVAVFLKFGVETVRLAILRSKGIPLLGLGDFTDPTGRLPGLPHQVATNMNDAGLTIYDEKGAVLPDFDFIGDSGFTQAKLLARLLEMVYQRQVQRINVDVSVDAGQLNAAISLVDSANGYVRYLHMVALDPDQFSGPGELTKVISALIADTVLISLAHDPNTRGLLYQRMGDWSAALKEFIAAAEHARAEGKCGELYQAHLNLGNLYSFLGLQDKSVAAYTEVAENTTNPATAALVQAAMACSYKNWQLTSPPDQQDTYEWLARQAIERALSSDAKTYLVDYTIACYFSLAGQIQECLTWLREAVAGDLAYLEYVMTDPDMESLRRWLGTRTPGEALGLRVG